MAPTNRNSAKIPILRAVSSISPYVRGIDAHAVAVTYRRLGGKASDKSVSIDLMHYWRKGLLNRYRQGHEYHYFANKRTYAVLEYQRGLEEARDRLSQSMFLVNLMILTEEYPKEVIKEVIKDLNSTQLAIEPYFPVDTRYLRIIGLLLARILEDN
jgi:predicted transcriptional regulator